MTSPVLLCTDGSDHSLTALAAGLAVLRPDSPLVIVMAIDEADPSLLVGTGFAGGVVSPEEFDVMNEAAAGAADAIVATTKRTLGIDDAESRVIEGSAGPAICLLATELSAAAIVIGSRGRSGFKRAMLGSVSDHVVRHAPCPVIVTS